VISFKNHQNNAANTIYFNDRSFQVEIDFPFL
jgi:hypothetical protein